MDSNELFALFDGVIPGPIRVCDIPPALAAELGAITTTVLLSAHTRRKQDVRHDDLTMADYEMLPAVIRLGEHRRQAANKSMILFMDCEATHHNYRACIKATADGRELYVVSFHRLGEASFARDWKKPLPVLRPHFDK
ncbi:MAG: hypothetical protein ACYDD1_14070 [Caulobacteraceae bacterium]